MAIIYELSILSYLTEQYLRQSNKTREFGQRAPTSTMGILASPNRSSHSGHPLDLTDKRPRFLYPLELIQESRHLQDKVKRLIQSRAADEKGGSPLHFLSHGDFDQSALIPPEIRRAAAATRSPDDHQGYCKNQLHDGIRAVTEQTIYPTTSLGPEGKDKDIRYKFISGQGDEICPSELKLLLGESAQEEGQAIARDEGYDDNSNITFNETTSLLNSAKPEPSDLLHSIRSELTSQENRKGLFHSNASYHQNYAHFEELLDYHCFTQARIEAGSSDLYLHTGNDKLIYRWKRGSTILYSVDYKSFKRSDGAIDADYALECLETALGKWNAYEIGVKFNFVPPETDGITFNLSYKPMSSYADTNLRVFARAFFPADAYMRTTPRKLYIFGVSFDAEYRQDIMRIFLHEAAHILGGRHSNAATAETSEPCVLLGATNDTSVLDSGRPGAISLYPHDVDSFRQFMNLPNGTSLGGCRIHDIVPGEVFRRLS
ncbi:hypothetical protein O1611_g5549 [Lasiodiplodia mahajangana]|uniref:Uncharacterized protein n=1 Tax=Lasiodiplodia mahajangana TaxID=1108764 RepID=A0ACC2JKQ5_9PEZI|nr:hypothetical protein O1611_g5549 [Lasiodiplodia mahajangana]